MFESTIRTALLADDALRALIANRVKPLQLSQGERKASIAYQIGERDDPAPSHDGPSTFTRVTYDVITIAPSYDAALQISDHVRRVLGNFSGTSDETTVAYTRFTTETDIEQDTGPGGAGTVFVRSQTFRAMYRAADPAP